LDVSDKHWLLLPVIQAFDASGIIVEDEQGRQTTGNTYAVTVESAGPYHIAFPRNYKIKNAGKLSVLVAFGERSTLLGNPSVSHALRDFSNMATYVVNGLNAF
jgi:hypothetical protein